MIRIQPTYARSNTRDMEYVDEIYFHRVYDTPWFHIEPHLIKTALDLGAHIGSFTLWAVQRWPNSNLHSYEPNAETFELLTKNVGLLNSEQQGQIKILNQAVWKDDCPVQLYKSRIETGSTTIMPAALPDELLPPIITSARSIKAAMNDLGGSIDFLKMDCEGAEYEIMYSLPTNSLSKIKFIAMEYHGYGDPYKLVEYLRNASFAVQILPNFDNQNMGYIYAANLDLVQIKVNDIFRYQERYLLLSKVHKLIDNEHRYDSAESLLNIVLQSNPEDPESNYLFAFCLHIQNKDLELAMKHYDFALAQSCDSFWILYNQGSLHAKLGNIEQARIDLIRAIGLRPEHQGAQQVLRQLAAIEQSKKVGGGAGEPGRADHALIAAENARVGTADWKLSSPAVGREIEGYASLTSVNRGGEIELYVHTAEPIYTIEIYRVGWYSGLGGRLVVPAFKRTGLAQKMPEIDPETGLIDCDWQDPYRLRLEIDSGDPLSWLSGVYLAKLTAGASGKQSYIIFVVRDDERSSDLLFQSSVMGRQVPL